MRSHCKVPFTIDYLVKIIGYCSAWLNVITLSGVHCIMSLDVVGSNLASATFDFKFLPSSIFAPSVVSIFNSLNGCIIKRCLKKLMNIS